MRSWKKVVEVGRWRIAVMGGGRYRFGTHSYLPGSRTFGLGLCVISVMRRSHRDPS